MSVASLESLQKWFASIITRPIDVDSRMEMTAPNGKSMVEEAACWIVPSPTLQPHERIELYNQQYWWRLLTILQEDYPFLVRLFGYTDFNLSIGIPYLTAVPPNHWSISQNSFCLPDWLKKNYQKKDSRLVIGAAEIDCAFAKSFTVGALPAIEDPEQPFCLQSHVNLFSFHLPLFDLREALLKEDVSFWEDNDFPKLENPVPTCYILWRNANNRMVYYRIDQEEHALLSKIASSITLEDLCGWLEGQPEELLKQAETHLDTWFQKWVRQGWLAKLS